MDLRKVIVKAIRSKGPGVDVAGEVHSAVAMNVNEPGKRTKVSSHSRIVQRAGRTESVTERHEERGDRE